MRLLKPFILIGFLVMMFLVQRHSKHLDTPAAPRGIISLELASVQEGKMILAEWDATERNHRSLLDTARIVTNLDFTYILFYVSLLVMLSNALMFREPSIVLNSLLRMNLFVAVLAGLLDIVENSLTLVNFHRQGINCYISTAAVAWPKFVLLAWAILVLVVALIKRLWAFVASKLAGN